MRDGAGSGVWCPTPMWWSRASGPRWPGAWVCPYEDLGPTTGSSWCRARPIPPGHTRPTPPPTTPFLVRTRAARCGPSRVGVGYLPACRCPPWGRPGRRAPWPPCRPGSWTGRETGFVGPLSVQCSTPTQLYQSIREPRARLSRAHGQDLSAGIHQTMLFECAAMVGAHLGHVIPGLR